MPFLKNAKHQNRGFTLVELLVVIVIIGILIGLLLPAVQKIREAANRTSCQNNLKQIGLAIFNYEESIKKLPPGAFWKPAYQTNIQRSGILLQLLPYLDQQNIYDKVDFTPVNTNSQVLPGTTDKFHDIRLAVFICPSDEHPESNRGPQNYAASAGPTRHGNNGGCSCSLSGALNALGTGPYGASSNNFAGMFHRRGISLKLSEVDDGLSNTILFGEVRPSCSVHIKNGWFISNNGQGLISTLIPINFDTCDNSAPDGCNRPCNWSTELGFRSSHAGGAYFLFGDGRVTFLPDDIDMIVYNHLGDRRDGSGIGSGSISSN